MSGSVQGGTSAMLAESNGAAVTGTTVTIVGTAITSGVDGAGRFLLANVPPGDIQIRISGPGTDASVTLAQVQASQTVEILVIVAGTTARIETEQRNGAGEAELEGRVEALPPATPPHAFKVAGRLVNTDSSTGFLQGTATRSFADLQVGMRVKVKGRVSGDTFAATSVVMKTASPAPGPGHDANVELSGAIDALTGSASAFQFTIGGRLVKGGSATTFAGEDNKAASFADLKSGARVEVKGQQADGFVQATRIHVESQEAEASVHGTLKVLSGAAPNLLLTVGTMPVRTTNSTQVKQHGRVVSLDALKVGQSLEVEGSRQSDASIVAKKISIEDETERKEGEAEGAVSALAGACPELTFSVGSTKVVTGAATQFEGGACASLKNADKVEVKGTKRSDGVLVATRVKRKTGD